MVQVNDYFSHNMILSIKCTTAKFTTFEELL